MRTKQVFSLTSLFLAGVAVCGCQSTNPTPPIRPQAPWQSTSTQTRPLQSQQTYTQGGTVGSNGMVMQNGTGGTTQYGSSTQYTSPTQFPTTSTGSVGSMGGTTGGSGIYSGMSTSSGLSGQSNLTNSTGGTSFAPQSPSYPTSGSTTGLQRSNYSVPSAGTDVGGVSVRQTQCPAGTCPTGDSTIPPPPTNTLQTPSSVTPH